MRFIDKFKSWKGKKVIIRVDFNVPIEKGDILGEMWRVESSIPTIKFLLDQEVSRIVFLTHIGRPKGKVVDALSTKHLIYTLNKLLGEKVAFVNGFNIKNLRNRIILLENLRFHIEEKENNENFAKKLAKLGDIYVNDAFSVSHRAHASIDAITKFLPCFGGFEMKREIQVLTGAYENLKDCGINLTSNNLHLPVDAKIKTKTGEIKISAIGKINKGDMILDIGPNTNELFANVLKNSKMIIWNGPMGKFEERDFEQGTKSIANNILKSKAKTIIGGGDTLAFLE